jgi:hypothetical protein
MVTNAKNKAPSISVSNLLRSEDSNLLLGKPSVNKVHFATEATKNPSCGIFTARRRQARENSSLRVDKSGRFSL